MNRLKNFSIVMLVLLVISVLVIVKTTEKNRFKQDAQNAVEALVADNFTVSVSELKNTENQYLIIDLNESGSPQFENALQIPFEKLLDESSLQKLKDAENKILLVSSDNSKAEKIWVILNQLGFKNVFVFSSEENQEVLKYEFVPDTSAKLETVIE